MNGAHPMQHHADDGLALDTNSFSGSNLSGLLITIFAAIISNLGAQLQKQAHRKTKTDSCINEYDSQKPPMCVVQKQWIAGLILVIIGAIGDFEALRYIHI